MDVRGPYVILGAYELGKAENYVYAGESKQIQRAGRQQWVALVIANNYLSHSRVGTVRICLLALLV